MSLSGWDLEEIGDDEEKEVKVSQVRDRSQSS